MEHAIWSGDIVNPPFSLKYWGRALAEHNGYGRYRIDSSGSRTDLNRLKTDKLQYLQWLEHAQKMPISIRVSSEKKIIGEYTVSGSVVVIGRSRSCSIILPAALSEISSSHAMLKEAGDMLLIMDGDGSRGSTNGIYIDGSRIQPGSWVSAPHNCTISLGSPTKKNAVIVRQIGVTEQNRTASNHTVVAGQISSTPVPIQLTNSSVNVAITRPEADRSRWKTPINLLIHLIGLGIVIAIIPAIMGSTLEAGIVIAIIVGLEIYFLPSTISFNRDQPNKFAILALNLFLGWTLLGWVLSLVWSLTAR